MCGLSLFVVLFVPLWQIELEAPQYPEGLKLIMHPHKLSGNVDIINGLNHYIGMKTLHTQDFIEFTILPYIISFFAAFCLLVAFINNRRWLVVLFTSFCIFGILAMADFYRWNYDYGHDLDPNAAIQVPGMSYQPPLIGYKQLLNFGAYSIPHIGGWIFISVGLLLLGVVIMEFRKKTKLLSADLTKTVMATSIVFLTFFNSCSSGPQPIKIGKDACSFCKMSIADNRFGAEIVTKKGKVFKFDDMHCLLEFKKLNNDADIKETYVVDFYEPHELVESSKAFFFKSDEFRSPMAGNVAGFSDANSLKKAGQKFSGKAVDWATLVKP